MPRVVHFELAVDNPDRAAAFYQDVFGWKIQKWEGPMDYWMVMTGKESEPGIDGGLTQRSEFIEHTTNTIEVPDIDRFLDKIVENGGAITMPKNEIPNVGFIAYCQDTEGNTFGLMQSTMKD